MPYCLKCGAKVQASDGFCMQCGTPRKNKIPLIVDEANQNIKRLATDEAYRIECVKKYTGRTDVNSDDVLVGMLRSEPKYRESFVYSKISREYVDKTQCSELPLDWKQWPNFILVENTLPSEMADNIAAFIKRTRNAGEILNGYSIYLISTDPNKSWSFLREAEKVFLFEDDFDSDAGEFYLLYKLGKEEIEKISNARLSNIYEYNKIYPDKYFMPAFLFIDDYDTFSQKLNDNRIPQEILPFFLSFADRLGFYFIFGSRAGSRALGNYKSAFTVKSSNEFIRMCKGNYSTGGSTSIAVSGYDFEQFCADLLLKKRYQKVEVTKKSGDQGIDILAERDCVKYAIQCKYYNSPVGNSAVQEAFAGKTFYGCHVAVVMTNSTFSDSAIQMASQLGVVLWDGNTITEFQETDN